MIILAGNGGNKPNRNEAIYTIRSGRRLDRRIGAGNIGIACAPIALITTNVIITKKGCEQL
jgi:hypothetical protein